MLENGAVIRVGDAKWRCRKLRMARDKPVPGSEDSSEGSLGRSHNVIGRGSNPQGNGHRCGIKRGGQGWIA